MIRCHLSVLSLPREQRRPSRRSRQPIPPTSRSSKRQKALPLSFPHWTDRIFRFLKISSTNLPAVCAIISFTETHLTFVVIVIVKQILPRKARPRYFLFAAPPPGGRRPRLPAARGSLFLPELFYTNRVRKETWGNQSGAQVQMQQEDIL